MELPTGQKMAAQGRVTVGYEVFRKGHSHHVVGDFVRDRGVHLHAFAQRCANFKFQSWPKCLTFYQSYRLTNMQPADGLS